MQILSVQYYKNGAVKKDMNVARNEEKHTIYTNV